MQAVEGYRKKPIIKYDARRSRPYSGAGKSLSYNAFNKPIAISQGGVTSTFQYGADLKRYQHKRIGGLNPGTTYYFDELEIEHSNGQIKTRHPVQDIAIETYTQTQSSSTWQRHYTHRDRLGSVVTVTNEQNEIVEHRSYDPFGKPRKGSFEEPSKNTIHHSVNEDGYQGDDGTEQAVTKRGFTDHEHLDDYELIHMNGRVYDYNLGRFLSVDPYIQGISSQAINPYSYILNNPLSGTDPSGYLRKGNVSDCRLGQTPIECNNNSITKPSKDGKKNESSGEQNKKKGKTTNSDAPTIGEFLEFAAENFSELWSEATELTNEQYFGDSAAGEAFIEATDPVGATIEAGQNVKSGNIGGAVTGVLAKKIPGGKALGKKVDDLTKGGAHGKVKGITGNESHHMPADSVSPLSKNKGPAISMRQADHRKTASWGNSKEARAYRQKQKELIEQGKFKEAQQLDVSDVQSKFGNKYDQAIDQMKTYTDSLD